MRSLIDLRMHDGSRHFGGLRERYDGERPDWHRLRAGIVAWKQGELTGFVTDEVTEAWIDFRYAGHTFAINDQYGEWWFFVDDPTCPDEVLAAVLDHFEGVLAR